MASTCSGHLHVHPQEFLYIGCCTAACGVMPHHMRQCNNLYITTPEDGHVNARNM